jgi:hypothetical protein
MDHKAACLAEAAACRIKVEADPAIVITGSMKRSNGSNGLSIRQSSAAAVSLEVDDGSSSPMRS